MTLLPWLVAAWLLGIGLYGIVTSRNYVHLIGCLGVVQSATYVLLLAIGYKWNAGAPIFYSHPRGTPAVDPVVQALVLTDIVIGAVATIVALCVAATCLVMVFAPPMRRWLTGSAAGRHAPAGRCSASASSSIRSGRRSAC